MGKMPNKSLWCEWDLYSHLLWFHISLSCYLSTCPSFEAPGERYPSAKLNLSKIYICRILESVGKIHQTPRSSYELVDTWSLIDPFRTKLGIKTMTKTPWSKEEIQYQKWFNPHITVASDQPRKNVKEDKWFHIGYFCPSHRLHIVCLTCFSILNTDVSLIVTFFCTFVG